LERTTNGHGKVSEQRWFELGKLELRHHIERVFWPELLPNLARLREDLHRCGEPLASPRLLIEIKPSNARQLIEDLVHKDRWHPDDMLQSFDEANLIHALTANPTIHVAHLVEDRATLERAVATGWDRIHLFHDLLDPPTAAWLQGKGVTYAAWTPNTPEEIRRACDLGVAMVVTDEPELARRMIERRE
jgi:glycerophosphoryl diester phosphodiesterase